MELNSCLSVTEKDTKFTDSLTVSRAFRSLPSMSSFPGDQAPHRCFDTQHLHCDISASHQHRGTQSTPQTSKQEPLKYVRKHFHSPGYYQQHSPCPLQLQLQQSLSTIRPQVNRISTGLLVPISGDRTLCPPACWASILPMSYISSQDNRTFIVEYSVAKAAGRAQ